MVVSVGVFDGLHRGHLTILDRTITLAKENEWESMVITFDKNPKMRPKANPITPSSLQRVKCRKSLPILVLTIW